MNAQSTINVMASQIDSTNGIGNIAYHLADNLAQKFNVRVYTNELNESLPEKIDVIKLGNVNVVIRSLRSFLQYLKLSKDHDISICMSWRLGLIPYICKKYCKTPYILLCHGNEVLPDNVGKTSLMERLLRKRIISNASYICANSLYTLDLVNKICRVKRSCVIHPGCGEKVHDSNIDEHYILSVGRIEERKGFQYVVKAFSMIKREFPTYKYIVAGDGNYRDALSDIINKENNYDCCVLLGRVSDKKKKELLEKCTALIMPSFMKESEKSVEGFGIVFLEANAYGKPSIGTDSGGIPDAIKNGETGLIIKQKDEKAIYDAIKSIITGTVIIKEEACKKWAMDHDYEHITQQYVEIINECMA